MKMILVVPLVIVCVLGAYYLVKEQNRLPRLLHTEIPLPGLASPEVKLVENPRTTADKIVNEAKTEAINGVRYDASYLRIPYPNGDVPSDQGACTDVIIRALRSIDYDLQKMIHEDMKRNFRLYPQNYGLDRPDPNIDHRRIPNQMTFMRRFHQALPLSTDGENLKTWKPGDLVYWKFENGLHHCGVISNDKASDGTPLVIHNIGITRQEDCLNVWEIIGHFRLLAAS